MKEERAAECKGRDVALDMLKGLCILLVVYGHLPRTGFWHKNLESIVEFIYTFHMPVFVLCSGFLLSRHPSNVTKIFNRIIKPYIVVAFAYIPLLYIFGRHSDAKLLSMIGGVFAGRCGGALWYLYDLAVVELLAVLGLALLGRFRRICHNPVCSCLVVLVTVSLGCAVLNLNDGKFVRIFPVWFCIYFLIGFSVGQFCSELPASIYGVVGVAISLIFLCIDKGLMGNYIFVMSLIVFLVYCFRKTVDTYIGKGLAWMGRHTLAILLFHPIFNPAVNATFAHLLKLEGSGIMVGLASLTANVSLCIALEALVKRTFFSKFIF